MHIVSSHGRHAVFAATLVIVAGCGTTPDAGLPPQRPLGGDVPTYRAPVDPAADDAAPLSVADSVVAGPGDSLALRQALSLALVRNPGLRSFGHEMRAREARALQAGLWPNPGLAFEVDEFGGTGELSGFESSERRLLLTQRIPLGGDVGDRADVARLDRDRAGWDVEAARLDVFTRVTKQYVSLLAAQQRVRLADSLLVLSERFYESVQAQVEAGEVSPLEEKRARIVLSNARVARERAARERRAARTSLAATWGETDPAFRGAEGRLDGVARIPEHDTLVALLEQNPNVARWGTETAYRRQVVELEEARRIPDPTLKFGGVEFGGRGERALNVEVELPLPLFDRRQGAIRAARYRVRRAESRQAEARVRARDSLSAAYARLAASHREAKTLGEEALPAARETFRATQEGYERGKFDLLRVLDAQRTLVETANQYLDALASYHRARADVQRLVAAPLPTPGEN
jgi:cobalt-zinc-cadmium efflux system outer membrane protein